MPDALGAGAAGRGTSPRLAPARRRCCRRWRCCAWARSTPALVVAALVPVLTWFLCQRPDRRLRRLLGCWVFGVALATLLVGVAVAATGQIQHAVPGLHRVSGHHHQRDRPGGVLAWYGRLGRLPALLGLACRLAAADRAGRHPELGGGRRARVGGPGQPPDARSGLAGRHPAGRRLLPHLRQPQPAERLVQRGRPPVAGRCAGAAAQRAQVRRRDPAAAGARVGPAGRPVALGTYPHRAAGSTGRWCSRSQRSRWSAPRRR